MKNPCDITASSEDGPVSNEVVQCKRIPQHEDLAKPDRLWGRVTGSPGLSSCWVMMIKPALSRGDFHLMSGLNIYLVVIKYLLLKATEH